MTIFELCRPSLLIDRSTASAIDDDELINANALHHDKRYAVTTTKMPASPPPSRSVDDERSLFSLHDLYKMNCAPGLVLLSDDDSSSFASCGTSAEDFFGPLNLLQDSRQQANTADDVRRVRFACVYVREYSRIVGDQNIRLPLSLGWSHGPEQLHMIDEYDNDCDNNSRHQHTKRERDLQHQRRLRRQHRHFKLDYWQRREILQCIGNYSSSELTKIEQKQNQDAVSEFLAEAAAHLDGDCSCNDINEDDIDAGIVRIKSFLSSSSSYNEYEEQGIEVVEPTPKDYDDCPGSYLELEGAHGYEWQMTVQVLE